MSSVVPDVGAESPAVSKKTLEMIVYFILDMGPDTTGSDSPEELAVSHKISSLKTLVELSAEEAVMVKEMIGSCIGVAVHVEQADGQPYFWSGRVTHPGDQTEEVR